MNRFSYPLPLIAVPTTAGTGSEVTMWGSLWDRAALRKYSVAHPSLYPEQALMLPTLTAALSWEQSLFPALDALSHAMEAIWNRNANPVSDELAAGAIRGLLAALEDDYRKRYALPECRCEIQVASLLAGLASSNTRTAIAHSISYPLTAAFGVPYGLACSFTLPQVLALNAGADAARIGRVARAMGCADAALAARRLQELYRQLEIGAALSRYLRPDAAASLEAEFLTPGPADNNLAPMDRAGARALLARSFEGLGL